MLGFVLELGISANVGRFACGTGQCEENSGRVTVLCVDYVPIDAQSRLGFSLRYRICRKDKVRAPRDSGLRQLSHANEVERRDCED